MDNEFLRKFIHSEDTLKKLKKLETNLNFVFDKDTKLLSLINNELIKDSRYCADKFFKHIEEVIKDYFDTTFGSRMDLSSVNNGSKIFYNFWLFMDGDWVLKNPIISDLNEVIVKEQLLLYTIIYCPDTLKLNLENLKKRLGETK